MNRPDRIARIIGRLATASEPTLHRIETDLGMTPRPESPDAGAPWAEIGVSRIICSACNESADQCKCPSLCFGCMNDFQGCHCGAHTPMTPVSERGMHE